ncbi:MAG TPA: dihydrodipicolinate synthase family protein [Chloroflexota bacterium]
MRNVPNLRGVIVPLVTPFNRTGGLDEAALRDLIEFLLGTRVHGLFPGGTTGEAPLLTDEERRRVAETTVSAANGRVPVIVQTGATSTDATIALTRHAREIGADAAAIVTPHYFRLSDEALVQHYVRVAEAVPDYPLFLYNIPQLTGNNLVPSLVAEIARRCPNVVGMKDSWGNLTQIIDSRDAAGGDFQVAIGGDGLILSALAVGIPAAVSGHANPCPELFVELFEAFWRGDAAAAASAQARVQLVRRILKDGGDMSLLKAVVSYRGIPVGGVRAPLLDAPSDVVDRCLRDLADRGITLTHV